MSDPSALTAASNSLICVCAAIAEHFMPSVNHFITLLLTLSALTFFDQSFPPIFWSPWPTKSWQFSIDWFYVSVPIHPTTPPTGFSVPTSVVVSPIAVVRTNVRLQGYAQRTAYLITSPIPFFQVFPYSACQCTVPVDSHPQFLTAGSPHCSEETH